MKPASGYFVHSVCTPLASLKRQLNILKGFMNGSLHVSRIKHLLRI